MTGGPAQPLPRLRRRPDIQGLRALAVSLVILAHVGVPGLQGGFVGVDVFFVVSGYLISSLLLHEATTTGRVRIGMFYARRARRILPAAALVLLVTSVYAAMRLSLVRVADIVDDVRWSALFAANIHFARLGTDYFDQDRAVSPVQHFWSLAVEEQFYLVWPAGLMLLFAVAARHRVRLTVAVVTLAWVASLTWSVLDTTRIPVAAYFSSAPRAWELATGALLALAGHQLPRLGQPVRWALSLTGLAAILAAGLIFDDTTPFPSWRALLPVLGASALLAAGATGPVGAGRLLTVAPVRYVGDISYSLYLWHWPVLILAAASATNHPSVTRQAQLVALIGLLSVLSYHLVENPIRHAHGPVLRGRRALLLWPVALGLVLAGGAWANDHAVDAFEARIGPLTGPQTRTDTGPATGPATATGSRRPLPVVHPAAPSIHDLIGSSLRLADKQAPIPFPLVNLRHLRRDLWQVRFHCYADFDQPDSRVCPTGDRHAIRTVVLYGDSHAGMWLPPVSDLGRRNGFRVVPLVKLGCAPFDVTQMHAGAPYAACHRWRTWALGRMRSLHPDVVLVAFRGLLEVVAPSGHTAAEAWEQGAAASLRDLTGLAPQVEVISDITALGFAPGDCLTTPGSTMASCTQGIEDITRVGNDATRRAARATGTRFVDVAGLVCRHRRCPVVVDHVVTYHDSAHISATWGHRIAAPLGHLLRLPPQ